MSSKNMEGMGVAAAGLGETVVVIKNNLNENKISFES
jgi:hypothetical protein